MDVKAVSVTKYLGEREIKSKKGNILTLITIADPVNYEKFDFFKRDTINTVDLKPNDNVACDFEISRNGYNVNTDLISMKKV